MVGSLEGASYDRWGVIGTTSTRARRIGGRSTNKGSNDSSFPCRISSRRAPIARDGGDGDDELFDQATFDVAMGALEGKQDASKAEILVEHDQALGE